jgi:hypothetical protein
VKVRACVPAVRECERRSLHERQIVDSRKLEPPADEDLSRLLSRLVCRPPPEVLERQTPGVELDGECGGRARVEPAEAESLRQYEHVRREPVAAEVRAFVHRPGRTRSSACATAGPRIAQQGSRAPFVHTR